METLKGRLPVSLRLFAMDLTDRIQLESLKMALEKEKPRVVFLANAAGFGKVGTAGEVSLTDAMGMVQLNCQALCAVTRMVLPYMAQNGRILQYASAAAFLPQPGFSVYAATKAFVLSYSQALNAEEKSRGICVTAVCPGPVETEFFDIAETERPAPPYKRLTMVRPERVVKQAIADSMMGKSVSVCGVIMKGFHIISKVIPHSWILTLWGLADGLRPKQNGQKK